MWIFTKDGFLSIVMDRSHPGCLLVRARINGDIEHFFPTAKVERTENRDYLYRASVPKFEVACAVCIAAAAISYDNFKNSVDGARHEAYMGVWETMADLQEDLDG